MRGITQEQVESIGTCRINLIFEHLSIEHELHVVRDDFPIPSHGILGKDFLKKLNCVIDNGAMTLTVAPIGLEPATIYIQTEVIRNVSAVPPRSETFKLFHVRSNKFPCVVLAQDIKDNVYIPTTIVHDRESWIRVLNVNNHMTYIQTDKLKIASIDEVDILKYDKNKSEINIEREKLLEKTLKNKIPDHAKDKLLPLCVEFSEIFHLIGDKATTNNFYTQELRLRDKEPVFVKNYRLPQSQKAEIRSQIQKLLADDLIELSTSSYNSPLIIVPKKSTDGSKKYRLCVDYRLLNKKLIPDKHPLPRIDEILDGLGRARYFSVMDLHSGYHQIPLEPKSRPLTAFTTDTGYYQFKVLPFGISIAPAAFTRMMTIAFAGLSPEQAFIYMDDLIVIGFSEDQHLLNLKRVFETCRKFNLKLNPEKCNFFKHEVYFLGHRCTDRGILPDPRKLFAVETYPKPKNAEETKRFTAFANYYRRFIPNFSGIAAPLNAMTSKRAKFEWTELQDDAFEEIKKRLMHAPVLAYPDFDKRFVVTVDASHKACGAVLSQNHDGEDKPIAFISRAFKKGELNKAIIEKELLAIHFAVTVFRPYLYGREFTVMSDHKPLIYLYKLSSPSSKLTRIRLDIEEYTFEVIHIKGKDNVVADALSRIHIDDIKHMYECEIFAITRAMSKRLQGNENSTECVINDQSDDLATRKQMVYEETHTGTINKVVRAKLTKIFTRGSEIASLTISVFKNHKKLFDCTLKPQLKKSVTLGEVILKLDELATAYNVSKIQWPLYDKMFKFCTPANFSQSCQEYLKNVEIILLKRPPLIQSKEEKEKILQTFHNDELVGGHCGSKRLYAKLRSVYYWPRMTKDVARFVRNCHVCKLTKPQRKTKQELQITDTPIRPFDIVQVDTIGPMPQSTNGFVYAITLIDEFSKYLAIIPVIDKSAKTVARAIFEKFILKYGIFKHLKTDLGTEYINEVINELCKLLRITHLKSTAYHHETVGAVERSHRSLNEYLRSYLNGNMTEWCTYADYFAFNYNTTPNQSTDHKFSPFELVFMRKPNMPSEFLKTDIDPLYNVDNIVSEMKYRMQRSHLETAKIIEKVKIRNKNQYDKTKNHIDFKIGEKIKIRNEPYNKFKYIYSGPFEIIDTENSNVIIDLNGKKYKIHKNRITKY